MDIAGRSKTPLLTADGVEVHWRINFLGTFHLTTQLLPLLVQAGTRDGNARVVITSSDVHHKASNEKFYSEQNVTYNSWDSYAQAKLALVHFAFEINRRYEHECNLRAVALHPGSVRTNLTSSGLAGNPVLKRIHRITDPLMAPFFLTLEQGAQTSLFCATKADIQGGQSYEECAVSEASPLVADTAVAQRLWQETEKWIEMQSF